MGQLRERLNVKSGVREQLGDKDKRTLSMIANLGKLLSYYQVDGAERLLREALDGRREQLGVKHEDTLASIEMLGHFLMRFKGKSRQDEAE